MTDAELIRKQAEKIIELEITNKNLATMYNNISIDWANADTRACEAEEKLKQIKAEVEQYQFDSATNLQNKIKTILMSESGTNEH